MTGVLPHKMAINFQNLPLLHLCSFPKQIKSFHHRLLKRQDLLKIRLMQTPEIIKSQNHLFDYIAQIQNIFPFTNIISSLTFLECILEKIISGLIILKFNLLAFECDILKLLLVISLKLNSSSSQDKLKISPSFDSPSLIIFACIPNWPCCLNVIHAFPSSSLNKMLLIYLNKSILMWPFCYLIVRNYNDFYTYLNDLYQSG